MTVAELIRRAVCKRDAVAAGKVVEFFRLRRGLTAQAIYELVDLRHPISRPRWEALLYEID